MAAALGTVAVHLRLDGYPEHQVGSFEPEAAADEQGRITVNIAGPLAELLRAMAAELERQHAEGQVIPVGGE